MPLKILVQLQDGKITQFIRISPRTTHIHALVTLSCMHDQQFDDIQTINMFLFTYNLVITTHVLMQLQQHISLEELKNKVL